MEPASPMVRLSAPTFWFNPWFSFLQLPDYADEVVTTTICDYGLSETWVSSWWPSRFYFYFTQPLFIQAFMRIKNIYNAKPVSIHVLSISAVGELKHSFKAASMFVQVCFLSTSSPLPPSLLTPSVALAVEPKRCCCYHRSREEYRKERWAITPWKGRRLHCGFFGFMVGSFPHV